jgi:hypothetical protein
MVSRQLTRVGLGPGENLKEMLTGYFRFYRLAEPVSSTLGKPVANP